MLQFKKRTLYLSYHFLAHRRVYLFVDARAASSALLAVLMLLFLFKLIDNRTGVHIEPWTLSQRLLRNVVSAFENIVSDFVCSFLFCFACRCISGRRGVVLLW